MEDKQVYEVLLDIHKTLARIASSLEVLEKVARSEHPNTFKPPLERSPAPGEGRS